MSEQEKDKYREIFQMFDKNEKGTFGLKELQEVMHSYGMNPSINEVKDLIDEMDSSGSETINLNTFIEAFLKKLKDSEVEEELREAFKVFDKDGNGFLSTDDLRIAMTDWGEGLSLQEFEEMLHELDVEPNQQIDFEELLTILTSAHKSK